ncbi:hypothetical protein D9M68_477160 [compost metagenome]
MMATRVLRSRFGAYSFISATTLGINPPMPRPAMKRQMPNSVGEPAKPLSTVKPEKSTKQMAMPFLRPILSAREPNTRAPNIMPNSA